MTTKGKIKEIIIGILGVTIGFIGIVWGSAAIEYFLINPSILQFSLCSALLFVEWQGFRIMAKAIIKLSLDKAITEMEKEYYNKR